ncbi:hypothetical protein H0H87_004923 [Tephrocybe sp. NHM501043]|nr:hypothetical protein H0H87_004923 [Tephrocybe sp. NHM501043]
MPEPRFFRHILNIPWKRPRTYLQPPSPPPPWERWELDATFLNALSEWTTTNPGFTLAHILEHANLAIDQGRDLVDLIPDSPFPARGLVKALMQLVKLGAVCLVQSQICTLRH